MGHKVPQSQYFHGLWHSFFFSTVKDGIIVNQQPFVKIYFPAWAVRFYCSFSRPFTGNLRKTFSDKQRNRSRPLRSPVKASPCPEVFYMFWRLSKFMQIADCAHSTAMVTVFGSQPSAVKVTLISPASLPARTTAIT